MTGRRFSSGGRYTDETSRSIGVRLTYEEIAAVRAISSKPLAKAVRELALASIGFKRSEESEPA